MLESHDEPQRGHLYRVRKGDSLTMIDGKAGLYVHGLIAMMRGETTVRSIRAGKAEEREFLGMKGTDDFIVVEYRQGLLELVQAFTPDAFQRSVFAKGKT